MKRSSALGLLVCSGLLAGCSGQDDNYPQLLPLSEINQPPAIPAHAADAAANPEAVGAALEARRAAVANAAKTNSDSIGAAALNRRASELRSRAAALANTDLPNAQPTSAASEATSDPETDARVRALRDRAKDLTQQPVVGPLDTPLPPCPPDTTDPVAANCDPI